MLDSLKKIRRICKIGEISLITSITIWHRNWRSREPDFRRRPRSLMFCKGRICRTPCRGDHN